MKKVITCLLAAAIITGTAAVLPEHSIVGDTAVLASAADIKDGKITDKKFLKDIAWFGESPKKIDGVKGYMSNVFKDDFLDREQQIAGVLDVKNDYEYCYDGIWYSNTYRYSGTFSSLSRMYAMEPMPKKKSNGEYEFNYTLLKGTVKLKSKVAGLPVTRVQALAFCGQKKITKLVIPEGYISVDNDALNQMDGLKQLYLPKSLKINGDYTNIGMVNGKYSYVPNKNLTIYCWYGSDAHKYAKENGFKYILRDKNKSNIKYLYSKGKVTLSKTSYTYNGKAKKPKVTVKHGETTLKKGKDYTLSYKYYKKAGVATAVIKGKGKYDGTLKKNYTIKPRATSITKISSPSTGEIELSYKKSPTAKGYKIEYSKNKSFKNSSSITSEQLKERIYDLDWGKTYYVRVRPFVSKEFDKFIYGKYSAVKKITVKD